MPETSDGASPAGRWFAYLDQNVLSKLQPGADTREGMLAILQEMTNRGAVFVYSWVTVAECRGSERPGEFVSILNELDAHFFEPLSVANGALTASPNRAHELLTAKPDIVDEAAQRIEGLLKVMHFAMGWLEPTEAIALQAEMLAEMNEFWTLVAADLPDSASGALMQAKVEMSKLIHNLPFQKSRDEAKVALLNLHAHLPKNLAQLDAIPAETVVSYLFSLLAEPEQSDLLRSFPKGFWSKVEGRQNGLLTGFAFLLFAMGLVRDPRVQKKQRSCREKHFLGQFRDCAHLEQAARCALFVTFDRGAARLAKAVYTYAGVETFVVQLETQGS